MPNLEELTLSLDYTGLLTEVGDYLGYGRNVDGYSAGQLEQAEKSVQGGCRRFYVPEIPVQWSFLRPLVQLFLKGSRHNYDLADDYGGIQGDITILATNGGYIPIQIVNESMIRSNRSGVVETGTPVYAAVRPKPMSQGFGQRWEILFEPEPDQAYTVQFRQLVNPLKLSKTNRYPYGGMQHAQTVLQACLAEAEEKVQDIRNGPHKIAYMERLAASVSIDKQQSRPEQIGYCGDPSTPEGAMFRGRRRRYADNGTSTYNGTEF